MDYKKKAQKQAEGIKEEDREKEIRDSLFKSAKNQKEAAENLADTMPEANKAFAQIIDMAEDKDKGEAIRVLTEANKLLNDLRKGGDLNKIVAKIKAIK